MKKETILIVEDDLEIRTLIQFFLEKENFNVITAQNGIKALELMGKRHHLFEDQDSKNGVEEVQIIDDTD